MRRKNREEDRDGEQNQRRKQKDEYTHVLPVPVPGTSPCTWWYSVVLIRAQGSAPWAADAARYARAKKNATETCKWDRKERPVIVWCKAN